MSTATLTSLAFLKINLDRNQDSFDYLRPFVLQVLVNSRLTSVTSLDVRDALRTDFGLDIPEQTIHVVLSRLTKTTCLRKERDQFHIDGELPNPSLSKKQHLASEHITAVLDALLRYSRSTPTPFTDVNATDRAMRAFLSEFDITCLRSFLRQTAIPPITTHRKTDIILISKFLLHIQRNDATLFESVAIMAQGHMLANALLCPDLSEVRGDFSAVSFYLDTPLLLSALDWHGEIKGRAANHMIDLLRRWKGKVCMFTHTYDELRAVMEGETSRLESWDSRSLIVRQARLRGDSRSDLILRASRTADLLARKKIRTERTPRYLKLKRYQIDEPALEGLLREKLPYHQDGAMRHDINSVRSIFALRRDLVPRTIETCKAIFVTNNAAYATAAWNYGKEIESCREVSSVIADYSLVNLAWLKKPTESQEPPVREMLAYAVAALQPSEALWSKYLDEVARLERDEKITARDHQLLRSDPYAHRYLVDVTLGDEQTVDTSTVSTTLGRIKGEIVREEEELRRREEQAHHRTQGQVRSIRAEKGEIEEQHQRLKDKAEQLQSEKDRLEREQRQVRENIIMRCQRIASRTGTAVSLGGALIVFWLTAWPLWTIIMQSPSRHIVAPSIAGVMAVAAYFGIDRAEGVKNAARRRVQDFLVKREGRRLGLDIETSDPEINSNE